MGSIGDLVNLGVGADFLNEVSKRLAPGKVALVAEVGEDWVTPVDTRMEALGGTVYRRYRADVEAYQIERDIDATAAELREMRDELDAAAADQKDKLQAKVDETKAKLQEEADKADAKLDSLEKELDSKIDSIEKQMKEAKEEKKAKLENRIAALKSDYKTRQDTLKQAAALAKQALT